MGVSVPETLGWAAIILAVGYVLFMDVGDHEDGSYARPVNKRGKKWTCADRRHQMRVTVRVGISLLPPKLFNRGFYLICENTLCEQEHGPFKTGWEAQQRLEVLNVRSRFRMPEHVDPAGHW